MPIVLKDLESDDIASEADFSDFRVDSMKRDADSLDDLEVSSKATTLFNDSPRYHRAIESDARGAAKLCELGDVETEGQWLRMVATRSERQGKSADKVKASVKFSDCYLHV